MLISNFYEQSACKKSYLLRSKLGAVNPRKKLAKSLFMKFINSGETIAKFKEVLASTYAKLGDESPYALATVTEEDCTKYERFYDFLKGEKVICISRGMQTCGFEWVVDLITKDSDGRIYATIIHDSLSYRSLKGRSIQTSAEDDLYVLCTKYALEKEFPHILVRSVYLSNKNDKAYALGDFIVSPTADSNCHILNFSSYYKDNSFLYEKMKSRIDEVRAAGSSPKDCSACQYFQLCKAKPLALDTVPIEPKKDTVLNKPTLTKEQQAVVDFMDGQLLVCAGPGNGKTTTLVNRIFSLVKKGIHPGFILCLTFSVKAAKEIEMRCLENMEELPKVCTINALAYSILLNNQELMPEGRSVVPFTDALKMDICKNLTMVYGVVSGFKTSKMEGRNGYYSMLVKRIEDYCNNEEEFGEKHPELNGDFYELANQYRATVEYFGYTTFDEQISICTDILIDNPDLLEKYRRMYKYIMVDEFQDINDNQFALIKLLVGENGNLVVVGDDDQNIYSFRGANCGYMLNFNGIYPKAKRVILSTNFRSTEAITNASASLISNNKKRIDKHIVSESKEEGVLPVVVRDDSAENIKKVINELIRNGYQYKDIAILATKNSTLEKLSKTLDVPSHLAKAVLREDSFFLLVWALLNIVNNPGNDLAFMQLVTLFSKDVNDVCVDHVSSLFQSNQSTEGFESLYAVVETLCKYMDNKLSLPNIVRNLSVLAGYEGSTVVEAFTDLIEKNSLKTYDDLRLFLNSMLDNDEDVRVDDSSTDNTVTLITCHDSKGKEWPIVLLYNDFSEVSEETRKLFYVALTRAKKEVRIFEKEDAKASFAKEFAHLVK